MFVFVVSWKNVIFVGLRIEDVIAGDFGGSVHERVLAGTERVVPIGGLPPPFPVSLLLLRRPVPTHFRALSFVVYWTYYDITAPPNTYICIVFHCTVVSTTVCQFWTYFDIQTYLCPSFGNILILKLTFALFWLSGGLFVFCCLFFATAILVLRFLFFTFCIQWMNKRLFVI